jgi:hypothetical protein
VIMLHLQLSLTPHQHSAWIVSNRPGGCLHICARALVVPVIVINTADTEWSDFLPDYETM